MERKQYTFSVLPATLEELKALPESSLQDPFASAALCILALAQYPKDREVCYQMMEFLKGPAGLTPYDRQFIRDRLFDKDYVPRSYFAGATPENNYTPAQPFTLAVEDNPYSRTNEGYITLYLTSGGADSPRSMSLRLKPSTGQWFVHEYGGLLMGIRIPKEEDPWA